MTRRQRAGVLGFRHAGDGSDDGEEMKVRAALFGMLMLTTTLPLGAGERMTMKVSPAVAFAPANLIVRAMIVADADNRAMEIIAESEDFYRSSRIQLEGDHAARTNMFEFRSLPPGIYELKLTAAPTGAPTRADSALQPTVQVKFEVRSRFAEASIAEKVPLNRLGTLPAKRDSATATATQRTASKGSSALAAAPTGAASVPVLKLPQQHASPFTFKPSAGLTTSLEKPVSRVQGDIGSTPAGPRPTAIDKLAPNSAF